jgi:hypothetical protein
MNLNPDHYSRWKIEPIEFIRANNLDFYRANIIKYIMRHDAKDELRDLQKALQYLKWFIEDMYPDAPVEKTYRMETTYPVHDGIIMNEEDLVMAERAMYENAKEEAYDPCGYKGP